MATILTPTEKAETSFLRVSNKGARPAWGEEEGWMGGEGGLKRVLQNCVAGGDEFY